MKTLVTILFKEDGKEIRGENPSPPVAFLDNRVLQTP